MAEKEVTVKLKRAFAVEQKCMERCVEAIDTLEHFYLSQSAQGDSVARGAAKQATERVLVWLVRYYEQRTEKL